MGGVGSWVREGLADRNRPAPRAGIGKLGMKKFGIAVGLGFVCLLLQGCVTSKESYRAERHFNEGKSVNAVLQFSSWDYMFLVKPAFEENGFLQQVRRDNLRQVLDRMDVQREMAVVVIGLTYEGEDLYDLVGEMRNVLGTCGFQRAVFLRANGQKNIDGSVIIDDSELPIISAQTQIVSRF
jgi:hypothetical protein